MTKRRTSESLVAERLEEAAETLRRLPAAKVQGYFSAWPPVVRDFWEAFGWETAQVRLGPPTPGAIDRMDEALAWLRWLEPDTARILWLRACGVRWKLITWRMGIGRTKAWQIWIGGLATIAVRLDTDTSRRDRQALESESKNCPNKIVVNRKHKI